MLQTQAGNAGQQIKDRFMSVSDRFSASYQAAQPRGGNELGSDFRELDLPPKSGDLRGARQAFSALQAPRKVGSVHGPGRSPCLPCPLSHPIGHLTSAGLDEFGFITDCTASWKNAARDLRDSRRGLSRK